MRLSVWVENVLYRGGISDVGALRESSTGPRADQDPYGCPSLNQLINHKSSDAAGSANDEYGVHVWMRIVL